MYFVMGASGQTGAATANTLLAQGKAVKVLVRRAAAGEAWAARGASVAIGDLSDPASLIAALDGCEAAYLMNPPAYGSDTPFAIAERTGETFRRLIETTSVKRAVVLSSFGAHLPAGTGMIRCNHLIEQCLADVSKPVAFLRPGYFLENWLHVLGPVRDQGVLPSMLEPLDRAIPMLSVADIGQLAAKALAETWVGRRVLELAGPTNVSPAAVANVLSNALGTTVTATIVPRAVRADILAGGGMSGTTVAAFVEMYDALNSRVISFEGAQPRRGETTLTAGIDQLLAAGSHA